MILRHSASNAGSSANFFDSLDLFSLSDENSYSPPDYLNNCFSSEIGHSQTFSTVQLDSNPAQNFGRSTPKQANSQEEALHQLPEKTNSNPFPVTSGKNCLSSTEIKKHKLVSAERVVSKYSKMKTESKVGTLAVKLARQSFFGDDVMRRCTVQGVREYSGLPFVELGQLKQTIFKLFPQYWRNPSEFEGVWSTCVESVGQACKRLRSKTVKM